MNAPCNAELSNPLVLKQPAYISDGSGRILYLGHSSTWSFGRHLLHLASRSPHFTPSAESSSNIDGKVFQVHATELSLAPADIAGLPSLELSLFYVQSVKFRTYPFFHLFDESNFLFNLHRFHQDFATYAQTYRLWYVHYLLVMAFGKAFAAPAQESRAGAELFDRALRLLPDITLLCSDPVASTEIFCCIALYLQSIDHRSASQVYVSIQIPRQVSLMFLHSLVKR